MRSIILFAAAISLATSVVAQTEQDHAAHHPDGASAPAAAVKQSPAKARTATAPKAKAAPAETGMGMAGGMDNMKDMHDQMHKPGGMHDQMHGKDGKMMGGQTQAMPPAPAASK